MAKMILSSPTRRSIMRNTVVDTPSCWATSSIFLRTPFNDIFWNLNDSETLRFCGLKNEVCANTSHQKVWVGEFSITFQNRNEFRSAAWTRQKTTISTILSFNLDHLIYLDISYSRLKPVQRYEIISYSKLNSNFKLWNQKMQREHYLQNEAFIVLTQVETK